MFCYPIFPLRRAIPQNRPIHVTLVSLKWSRQHLRDNSPSTMYSGAHLVQQFQNKFLYNRYASPRNSFRQGNPGGILQHHLSQALFMHCIERSMRMCQLLHIERKKSLKVPAKMDGGSLVPGGFDVMLEEARHSSNIITVKNEIF